MNFKKILPIVCCALPLVLGACSDSDSSSSTSPTIDAPVDEALPEVPETPEETLTGEDVVPEPTLPENPEVPETPTLPAEPTTPEAPSVTDPNITYSYYGAELSGRDQFKYGRFEARMKMLSIPGSVSSMFLYYDNSWMGNGEIWNEIDIEIIGKSQTAWQSNIITGTAEKKVTSEAKPELGFNATEDFHLYAIIWTPEYVAWEIDSVEVRRDSLNMTKAQIEAMNGEETQTLRFNVWASKSTAWVGKFTGEELADGPKEQQIDYVRVYSYDTESKTFKQEWQDDFEGTSLSEHWNTGNWEMERVMLSPENVVVEEGLCKLRLSREAD